MVKPTMRRPCPVCGQRFDANRNGHVARFCSHECRAEASAKPAPSLEQIRERCVEIQAGWDPETEVSRRVTKTILEWEAPMLSASSFGIEAFDGGGTAL